MIFMLKFAKWSALAMVILVAGFYIPTTLEGWQDEYPRPFLMLGVIGGVTWQFFWLRSLVKEEENKLENI